MKTLYHPEIYDDSQPVPSYWEASAPPPDFDETPLTGEESCEVAVIGGGYTGVSAALHLAKDHGVDVRLLEAGHVGWGASGRNGGFVCFAATKLSIGKMIKRYGLEETKAFWAAQLEGAALDAALIADEEIDCDKVGAGNFDVAHAPNRLPELRAHGQELSEFFGIKTRLYSREEFLEIGHESTEQFGALHVDAGFALHPLKFARGLGAAAARRGARLHGHSKVVGWRKEKGRHVLTTESGARLRADKVVLATNGFSRDGLHPAFDSRFMPALSNILTTRPLSEDELAAQGFKARSPICNTRTLLFYYRRLPDDRILFGARGDTTGRPQDGARFRAWLERRFGEVFPAWKDIEFSHFWRGLVCLTPKLTPAVGQLEEDPSVYFGYGYHANGVNTAPWVGRKLAWMIAASNSGEAALPAVMAGQSGRFPGGGQRLWGLRAAYLYYRFQDAR
ncbi:MAG: FAD-binding oxidoreductase [Rhodovibrionaceae bacterium]